MLGCNTCGYDWVSCACAEIRKLPSSISKMIHYFLPFYLTKGENQHVTHGSSPLERAVALSQGSAFAVHLITHPPSETAQIPFDRIIEALDLTA